MHPEVQSDKPGSCPKCGMALEPFLMLAEKVGGDTILSRIVNMVAGAQRSRAPIQKVADTVAGY